jgi:hypothetical protein
MTEEEICRIQAEHWARPASEYYQAGKFHGMSVVPDHDPNEAHELIKVALQRHMPTNRDFWLRVLAKIPYMGPVRKKKRVGKRGPVPLGDQYTDAYDRRRNFYRLLRLLPEAAKLKESDRLDRLAALVVATTNEKRKRLSKLRSLVSRSELSLVSDSTLKRYMKRASVQEAETS